MKDCALRLPVSGLDIRLQEPAGVEDMLLLDAKVFDAELAVALLTQIAVSPDGSRVDWFHLSLTDLDTALLLTRCMLFGEQIWANAICPSEGCAAPIEISFDIQDYLAHHAARQPRGVQPSEEPGWFQFQDDEILFRVPVVADQLAIAHHPHPRQELVQRCMCPTDLKARQVKRVEKAMEAIAPSLAGTLQGKCVECGAEVELFFDPQQFILRELRNQASFIYEDIHLLAFYYQWSEPAILALPRHRRMQYAEMIRQARRVA